MLSFVFVLLGFFASAQLFTLSLPSLEILGESDWRAMKDSLRDAAVTALPVRTHRILNGALQGPRPAGGRAAVAA